MAGNFSWTQEAEKLKQRRKRLAIAREQMEHCPTPLPFGDTFFLTQLFMGEDATETELIRAEEIVKRYFP